jgi:hypothetical protein
MVDVKKNALVWDGVSKGFYEAYYIQCNDPISGMAWWFRYSILIPKKGHGHPYAALWAVQFDPAGGLGPVAMKHVAPINHFRYEKDRFILYIDNGFMTNSHATGAIKHGDKSLKWDIQWTPIDAVFMHYPECLYSSPVPKSKVTSPHWATMGGGFIRWNEGEFFLRDTLIHVGHVWGSLHSQKWAWVHCHGFKENPTAVFEGLWVPLGGSLGLSKCWFNIDGSISSFWNVGRIWQEEKYLATNQWQLKLKNSKFGIGGTINVDPSQVAGVTYHSPDGSRRFCYNSKVSNIDLDVSDKNKRESYKLHAPGTAAFELCLPDELEKFPILV